jgi:uncharacterized protein YukE
MTPKNSSMSVDLPELLAHARAVAQIQQPMDRIVSAVKAATPDGFDLAYGSACQGIALAMRAPREWAEDVAVTLSRTIDATGDQLIKTVDEYDKTETANAANLRAIAANLPSNSHNGLIADGTKFDLGDYDPTKGGFLAKWDSPEDRVAGAGLWENSVKMYQEVTDSGKRNYGLMLGHAASMGLDGLTAANDPIGATVGWAAGWAMEHIKPLKLMLDMLAGNPDMIKGAAETWKRVGDELIRLGKHYDQARQAGTGGWNGDSGEAYQQTAMNTINALMAKGKLAHSMAVIVAVTGDIVDCARSIIRDLIGMALAEAVKAGMKRLGLQPPADELADLLRYIKWGKQTVTVMIKVVESFSGQLPMLIEAYKTLANIVPKLNGI